MYVDNAALIVSPDQELQALVCETKGVWNVLVFKRGEERTECNIFMIVKSLQQPNEVVILRKYRQTFCQDGPHKVSLTYKNLI